MEQYVMKNQKQLRCGITTGTCAAAAAQAAAELLLLKIHRDSVQIHTPKGITVTVSVANSQNTDQKAEYMVIKDSGDDPDVTNHAEIYVSVEKIPSPEGREQTAGHLQKEHDTNRSEYEQDPHVFRDERYPGLLLDGGEGVGRVTGKGLEQKVGQAAINAVPRDMIFRAVGDVCALAEYRDRLLITVRVPKGEELAKRTFNPRLGIEGGISILGTSGILEPMSEKAIVDTIEAQIRQLHAQGVRNLLVTPGNYGQSYLSDYLHLELSRSVKCSNYIGDTIDLAVSYGMENFLLVGNIGKLVKLAAGIMNTHSRVADGRCEILAVHAALNGAKRSVVKEIMECINTEEILGILDREGMKEAVMQSVCGRIREYMGHRISDQMHFGVILFSERYGFLGETQGTQKVLQAYRE